MTETDLRQFLEGLLVAWAIDAAIETGKQDADVVAWMRPAGAAAIKVTRGVRPFGVFWEVAPAGANARAHSSAQGAIRSLGAVLAPERPMARVLFAGGMAGQAARPEAKGT